MDIIKLVLDSLLHQRYNVCCLCLKVIKKGSKCYDIQDEIVFSNKISIRFSDILSCVIVDNINNQNEFVKVCHICTQKAIQAYKFVTDYREKSIQLNLAIKALHSYFENTTPQIILSNTLYACLDSKFNISGYNVNKEIGNAPCEILNKLQTLPKIEANIRIDFEEDCGPDEDIVYENLNKECDKVELIDIINDKNNLSDLKCKICFNTYSRAPNLKKHYYNVHAPKLFRCSSCPKSFGSAVCLKSHKKQQHGAALCCTECGKMYGSIYSLQIHEKRHNMRYTCQYCNKVYKTKHSFKSHVDTFHCHLLKCPEKFTCDYCGKIYSQKSAIRVHIQLEHGNGKCCVCGWCKKKFSAISRLKEHIQTHTKEKLFSCNTCGDRFGTKKSLLCHIRIHTGEKPYKCLHCDVSFLSASRRTAHINQHHMPATLECDLCHKMFKQRINLLRHRHRHSIPGSRLYNSAQV